MKLGVRFRSGWPLTIEVGYLGDDYRVQQVLARRRLWLRRSVKAQINAIESMLREVA